MIKPNTDCYFILNILKDYKWHNVIDIMQSKSDNRVNWAVRSRISDLKKKGFNIISLIDKNRQAKYKLIPNLAQLELFGQARPI